MNSTQVKDWLAAALVALALTAGGAAISGCSTVEGAGEDIEEAGDFVEDTADEVEDELD